MACGCGFKVNLNDRVPGTTTTWVSLVEFAVVFPYSDRQSFIFPMLVLETKKLNDVKSFVSRLIPGVDVTKCYFDISKWIMETVKELYPIGIWWKDVPQLCSFDSRLRRFGEFS